MPVAVHGHGADGQVEGSPERDCVAMQSDDLATLVEQHYENFDANGRALIPLTKIYWPSE